MRNDEKRQAALTALTAQNSREWTVGAGVNRLTISVENPTIRTIKQGKDVFTVDVIVRNRSGIIVYYDRFNMPDPPTSIRSGDQIITDPIAAMINTLKDATSAVTAGFTKPRIEKVSGGFKGDTLAVRSSTADGYVQDADTTWASTQNGPGETTNTTSTLVMQASGTSWVITITHLDFDASSLNDNAVISNGVLTLYGTGTAESDTDGATMECRAYDWGGTITTADWVDFTPSTNWTNLAYLASFTIGSWNETADAANNFTTQAGMTSWISKTAVSYCSLVPNIAYSGTPTGINRIIARSADTAGTASDPLLTITYTIPASLTFRSKLRTRSQLRR